MHYCMQKYMVMQDSNKRYNIMNEIFLETVFDRWKLENNTMMHLDSGYVINNRQK